MEANLTEIRLCPKCGSTENFETENASGNSICTKCSCRTIKIPLRAITETEICSSRCTFCNKENNEDILSENGNIVIFKCEKCGVIDAYLIIDEPYNDVLNEEPYDGNYSFKTIKKAENEGNLVFSAPTYKEVAKAFKKKKRSPIEQNIKQLRQIIKAQTEPLKKLGIADSTITNASFQARTHIIQNGTKTDKQLSILFAASILQAEDLQIRRKDLTKGFATERNISEIFNVDRKTIRKWKRQMEEKRHHPKWGVYLYQPNGLLKTVSITIPEDIEAVTKLEKPYNGKCCFFGGAYSLSWRIKYKNGGWSDICQRAYESFQKTYWENEGPLNLP